MYEMTFSKVLSKKAFKVKKKARFTPDATTDLYAKENEVKAAKRKWETPSDWYALN